MFYPLIRRALFALEPERAHAFTLRALQRAYQFHVPLGSDKPSGAPVCIMGLRFPNRVGLAAGFDKNACCMEALGSLGFGFIEVGTVTPRPQPGQDKPRVFRIPEHTALINRMGFPNDGAELIAERLARRRFKGICGVNIGKNATTPLERAVDDYVACFRMLAPHADYVAVNISSPNTAGLRDLQQGPQLEVILQALQSEREAMLNAGRSVPVLVKISPDLSDADLHALVDVVLRYRIDGVIATNTTLTRPAVRSDIAKEQGGLSGSPLLARALRLVRAVRASAGSQLSVIAAGGIGSGADALAALEAGADLVQIYTGLVYRGPDLVREIRRELS